MAESTDPLRLELIQLLRQRITRLGGRELSFRSSGPTLAVLHGEPGMQHCCLYVQLGRELVLVRTRDCVPGHELQYDDPQLLERIVALAQAGIDRYRE